MVFWRTPRGKPQYLQRTIKTKKFHFSIHRPWTQEFQVEHVHPPRKPMIHVEPIKDWSFFRGDRVEILVGPDKGKQGLVMDIIQERNWVIVEGLNTKVQCIGKTKNYPGTFLRVEQPLLVTTQVQLVDPFDLKGTPIEWKYTEEGEYVRVSSRTGRIIPMPETAKETIDYKDPKTYFEHPKDTKKDDVMEETFVASLKTFEMDIMEKMGIKEDRIAKKYYWY
ncbi:mitochondrial ribosomal protein L24 isoform X2 [Nomia melanderi]|uniref:mitochondrial ribosomal protein L24 isoform X2 n=1 Tax=Nomia melanderi TaxID=2448451 RepID=UPI0013041979|nr:probable 39S ribosomal protein L24, mitochondrial isoform X2 [Nomia melanderi]